MTNEGGPAGFRPGHDSAPSSEERGLVKRYLEKGFGFISRPSASDLFFHASDCECSRLYESEPVTYVLAVDNKGREVATQVRRVEGEHASGDILEWQVEPGTYRGSGLIEPHDGSARLDFSGEDLVRPRGPGARRVNPRPWHSAHYRLISLGDGSTRAVDIEIDWRYPLQRFAYLGEEEELIGLLRNVALDEHWEYRSSRSKKPHEILYNYLHFTFARIVDEDRGVNPREGKIRVRDDLKGHSPLAAFNTGLVDKRYESIFALFERNDRKGQQPWKFLAFCTAGEDAGKLLSRYFNPLPGPASYFSHASELLYDPDAPLHPDYRHIFENRGRLPQDLLRLVQHLGQTKGENVLKMHIDRAIDLARKRTRWNFKTAIPHYFPTLKRLELLLPLCLLDDATVDVALAVQRTEAGYIGNTILPLDWAYKSARLVCRPDSDWLAPTEIDAGEDAGID